MIQSYFNFTFSSIKGRTTYIDPRMALKAKPKVKGKVKVDTFKTAMDVLKDKNLSGKVVIITGANSGIGRFKKNCIVCFFIDSGWKFCLNAKYDL